MAAAVTLNGIGGAGDGVTGTVGVTGTSSITLNKGTYHSGSDQTYAGPVSLLADTSVTSDSGNVTFTSTIDGAHALSVLASLGGIAVDGLIGGTTALTALTLTGQTVLLSGIDHGGSAGVTGTVTVSGGSTLGEGTYHSGGTQTFTGPVLLAANTVMTSDSGDLRFVGTESTINSLSSESLVSLGLTAASSTGTVSLGGSVGDTTKLSSLLVDPASIVLGGAVYDTTGDQTYSQAVTLGASTSLTSDTGNITFLSTMDGAHSLSVAASDGTVSLKDRRRLGAAGHPRRHRRRDHAGRHHRPQPPAAESFSGPVTALACQRDPDLR